MNWYSALLVRVSSVLLRQYTCNCAYTQVAKILYYIILKFNSVEDCGDNSIKKEKNAHCSNTMY